MYHLLHLILTITLAIATPCPTEDSTNCMWDASTQGNGQGQSFVVLDSTVIYLTN